MARKLCFDKQACLVKAFEVFARKGYEATSIRDLAEAMGVQLASLYNAYGDKRAMFAQCLSYYIDNMPEPNLSKHPLKDIRQALKRKAENACTKDDAPGCFLINSAADLSVSEPELGAIAQEGLRKMERNTAEALKHSKAIGELAKDRNPTELAHYITGVMLSLHFMKRMQRTPKEINGYIKQALATLDNAQA